MAGTPTTGGRETSLALENPSQIPFRPSSSGARSGERRREGGAGAAAWGIPEATVRLLGPGLMEA